MTDYGTMTNVFERIEDFQPRLVDEDDEETDLSHDVSAEPRDWRGRWVSILEHGARARGLQQPFSSLEEAQAYATEVNRRHKIMPGDPQVQMGGGHGHSESYNVYNDGDPRQNLVLDPRMLDRLTVLHELAHAKAKAKGHGPDFIKAFKALLSEELPKAEVNLSNPSLGRTRLSTAQLLDGHDVVDILRRRNFSTPVSAAVKALVGQGTKTRPNARLYGHDLTLPIRAERDREALYRGGYILKAAERLQAAVDAGMPLRDALLQEKTYYAMHEKARAARLNAVTEAQRAGAWFGQPVEINGVTRHLVGWYINPLLQNDPECLAANRHNFYAEEGTIIGFPGAVHLNCGCYAGEPIPGAGMVNDALSKVVSLQPGRKPTYTLSRKRKAAAA